MTVHGKRSTYNTGCSCLPCCDANRDYMANYRAKQRLKPTPPPDWDMQIIEHALTTQRSPDHRTASTEVSHLCGCGHQRHTAPCRFYSGRTSTRCTCAGSVPRWEELDGQAS